MWTTETIASALSKEKIVIFAKGTANNPSCGFSARAIDIMKRFEKPIHIVDILSDSSIRPALIKYSDWPTTPQIYLDGQLLGGSDIVQEMFDSGDLQQKIAASFGEENKTFEPQCPIEITSAALAKIQEFLETNKDKLRLNVSIKNGQPTYELEIDTQSHPAFDSKYLVKGLEVVHQKQARELFEALRIDWAEVDGTEGFSVTETGHAPSLAVPLDIDKTHLKAIIDNPDSVKPGKFWLVDVREQHEWDSGHAESAVFLPLSSLEKNWQSLGFDKQDTIVMYCKRGVRSSQAANFFRDQLGFKNTRSLIGGVSEVPQELVN